MTVQFESTLKIHYNYSTHNHKRSRGQCLLAKAAFFTLAFTALARVLRCFLLDVWQDASYDVDAPAPALVLGARQLGDRDLEALNFGRGRDVAAIRRSLASHVCSRNHHPC